MSRFGGKATCPHVSLRKTNDRAEGHRGPPPVPSAYGENVARPEKTSIPSDPFPVQSACAFAFVEATAM